MQVLDYIGLNAISVNTIPREKGNTPNVSMNAGHDVNGEYDLRYQYKNSARDCPNGHEE